MKKTPSINWGRIIFIVGSLIIIRLTVTVGEPTVLSGNTIYSVEKGDTLESVADVFDVDVDWLLDQNDLKSTKLTPGQVLIVPVGKPTRTPMPTIEPTDTPPPPTATSTPKPPKGNPPPGGNSSAGTSSTATAPVRELNALILIVAGALFFLMAFITKKTQKVKIEHFLIFCAIEALILLLLAGFNALTGLLV